MPSCAFTGTCEALELRDAREDSWQRCLVAVTNINDRVGSFHDDLSNVDIKGIELLRSWNVDSHQHKEDGFGTKIAHGCRGSTAQIVGCCFASTSTALTLCKMMKTWGGR